MRALSWLAMVLMSGCLIPSLTDLESERPRACDDAHPCLTGYACLDGLCKLGAQPECMSGETRACGSSVGECRQGTQSCEGGQFGACVGEVAAVTEVCDDKDNDCDGMTDEDAVTSACELSVGVCTGKSRACSAGVTEAVCSAQSYGATFEANETRCDGLDNDCDGMTDEQLPAKACALNAGVCAGLTVACSNGAYATCTAADYTAHNAQYQVREAACDGLDNDCDGTVDQLAPTQVSDAGVAARRVAVAQRSADVLALYEAGSRVVARVLLPDGGTSAERFPSESVATAVTRAELPAVVSEGGTTYEAWFEVLATPLYRLVVAEADAQGSATVGGAPAVFPVGTQMGPGQSLKLALTPTRVVVAYSSFDNASATTSTVSVSSCPRALDALCITTNLGAGKNPALLADGDLLFVAWESSSGLKLSRLTVPSSGTWSAGNTDTLGSVSNHEPALRGNRAVLWVYYLGANDVKGGVIDCTNTCATLSATTIKTVAGGATAHGLVALDDSQGTIGWHEVSAGGSVVRLARQGGLSAVLGAGQRPALLRNLFFFDTEGAGNAVLAAEACFN